MLIWCGMTIFPTQMRTLDGELHRFVVNGCIIPHLSDPRAHAPANNDNEEEAT